MASFAVKTGATFSYCKLIRHKCAKPVSQMKRDACNDQARNREHDYQHYRMSRWIAIIRNPLHYEDYYGEKEIAEVDLCVGGAAHCRCAWRLWPDANDRR